MSEFLSKVVYLTPNQYNSLLLGQTIGGQTFDPSALYITNTPGDAETVNGHTVATDVPSGALFTDHYHTTGSWNGMTYTAQSVNNANELSFTLPTIPVSSGGTGVTSFTANSVIVSGSTATANLTTRGIYTLSAAGDSGWSTTANRTKIPDMSFIAYWNGAYNGNSSNITKLGTISTGIWQGTSIKVGYGGTGTTTAPTQGGIIYGASTSAYASTSAGTTGQYLKSNGTDAPTWATIQPSELGLANALHFIGITSTTLTDGSTTSTLTPKVASPSSLTKTTGFVDGDVVMDGDQLREYVWSGSAWRLLGITTSTAYSQTATGNSWITSITQGTDGKITATTGTLDTTGTWEGNAGTATKWVSAQKVYVTLGTASTTTTIQGGSTSAQTIGVDGTLGISNGGTGNTTFTQDCIITYTSNSKLESRGLKVTGATNADVIITPYATNKNLTINANGTGMISMTSTTGKLTVSSNYGSLILQGGAANTTTYSVLTLGNSTAKASANQSEGKITLYSASTAAHIIDGASTATDYTHTFPNKTGYIVIGSTDDIGSDTGPVYLSDGELIECASVVQTASFTLTGVSGAGSATIGSDTTISSNTEVIQISIDYTTASYLNSPISWTITNNRIVLSASVTTDESVTGKIYFIKNSA